MIIQLCLPTCKYIHFAYCFAVIYQLNRLSPPINLSDREGLRLPLLEKDFRLVYLALKWAKDVSWPFWLFDLSSGHMIISIIMIIDVKKWWCIEKTSLSFIYEKNKAIFKTKELYCYWAIFGWLWERCTRYWYIMNYWRRFEMPFKKDYTSYFLEYNIWFLVGIKFFIFMIVYLNKYFYERKKHFLY